MVGVLIGMLMMFMALWSSLTLSTNMTQGIGRYKLQQMINHELRREMDQLSLGTVRSFSLSELADLQNSKGYVDPEALQGPKASEVMRLEGQNYIIERTIQLRKWQNSRRDVDYVLVTVSLFLESGNTKGNLLGTKTKVITN